MFNMQLFNLIHEIKCVRLSIFIHKFKKVSYKFATISYNYNVEWGGNILIKQTAKSKHSRVNNLQL